MKNWKSLMLFGASALVLAACGNGGDSTGGDTDGGEDTGSDDTEQTSDAGESSSESFSIAMITDTGGIDDRSFNQSAWEGMNEWIQENGLSEDSIRYYQSDVESQYVTNMNIATSDGWDIIYAIGFLLENSLKTVAEQNPDQHYGIVDGSVDMPNVVSLNFKDHEAAFLAGVAAAHTTETDHVGFIGGVTGPIIDRFQTGFEAGVAHVDPNITVDVQYAESFSDTGIGLQIASAMFTNGADVIYHAAGGLGNGVFQEARNRMEAGSDQQLWVIGVDRDQVAEGEYNDGKDNLTLTSTLKQVGQAVKDSANKAMGGSFPGGENIVFGLAEEGVDLTRGNMSDEAWAAVEDAKAKIISGEIEVPEFTYTKVDKDGNIITDGE